MQMTCPCAVVWEMRMRRYICTYIYAHALCWEVHGMARAPAPPGGETSNLLAPPAAIARMRGQHPSGPDFVSEGTRGPGIAEPAPAPPTFQGRCARAFKITAHQPPPACASTNTPLAPCMCDRTCQYRPAVHARAHQMHAWACAGGRASQCR